MINIMLSVRPEYCEKILNGKKTIEIRKSMPKCELPCRVFIYCTKDPKYEVTPFRFIEGWRYKKFDDTTHWGNGATWNMGETINGKVVAEFTLNKTEKIKPNQIYNAEVMQKKACLSIKQLSDYIGGKTFYAWHIDDLKVYDQPKELSDFLSMKECSDKDWGDSDTIGCWECCDVYDRGYCYGGKEPMFRAPQSWCYCEVAE